MIHTATLKDNEQEFVFISLDGEEWLAVNMPPTDDDDVDQLRNLFTPIPVSEVPGANEGFWPLGWTKLEDDTARPILFHRSYLERVGATFPSHTSAEAR